MPFIATGTLNTNDIAVIRASNSGWTRWKGASTAGSQEIGQYIVARVASDWHTNGDLDSDVGLWKEWGSRNTGLAPQVIPIGQVVETDGPIADYPGYTDAYGGHSIHAIKSRTVGVTETDISQHISRPATIRTVSQALETDIANAFLRKKAQDVVQYVEQDSAEAMGRLKVKSIGMPIETDIANLVKYGKGRVANQVTETDLSQPFTHTKLKIIPQVIETDLSQILTERKSKVINMAAETDLAEFGSILSVISSTVSWVTPRTGHWVIATFKAATAGVPITEQKKCNAQQAAGTSASASWDEGGTASVGDLIVILCVNRQSTDLSYASTGFTSLGSGRNAILAKASDGTETGITVTTTLSGNWAFSAFVLRNAITNPATSFDESGRSNFTTNTESLLVPTAGVIDQADEWAGAMVGFNNVVSAGSVGWDSGFNEYYEETRSSAASKVISVASVAIGVLDPKKSRVVPQVIETDLSTAIVKKKVKIFGQSVETDISQPVGRLKKTTLSQALETDLSQHLTYPFTRLVRQSVETDIANAMVKKKSKLVAQSIETDLSRPIVRFSPNTINRVTETDLSQPILRIKTKIVNRSTETDISNVMVRKKRTVAQSIETDLANPFTHLKKKGVGQSIETDLSQITKRVKTKTLSQVNENDLATALIHLKRKVVPQAIETDLANPLLRKKAKIVSQTVETDLSRAISRLKKAGVGQSVEFDLARNVDALAGVQLGRAIENDIAFALAHTKSRLVSKVIEQDISQHVVTIHYISVGKAIEFDFALPFITAFLGPTEALLTAATPEAYFIKATPKIVIEDDLEAYIERTNPVALFIVATPEALIMGVDAAPQALRGDDIVMSLLRMIRGESAEWDVFVRHPRTKQPISLTGADLRFMAKREGAGILRDPGEEEVPDQHSRSSAQCDRQGTTAWHTE